METTVNKPFIDTYNVFERIGDVITKMAKPKIQHSSLSGELFGLVKQNVRKNKWILALDPNVYLGEDLVHPDLVICSLDKIKNSDIHGVPQVVMEILSPSTRDYDLGLKMETYFKYGVEEVWIVDPPYYSVDIYTEYGKPVYHYRMEIEEPHTALSKDEIYEANQQVVKSPNYEFIQFKLNDLFEYLISTLG